MALKLETRGVVGSEAIYDLVSDTSRLSLSLTRDEAACNRDDFRLSAAEKKVEADLACLRMPEEAPMDALRNLLRNVPISYCLDLE